MSRPHLHEDEVHNANVGLAPRSRRERREAAQAAVMCEVCARTVDRNRWARTRAHDEGWFESKDGRAWCPTHNPEWVRTWRAKRDEGPST